MSELPHDDSRVLASTAKAVDGKRDGTRRRSSFIALRLLRRIIVAPAILFAVSYAWLAIPYYSKRAQLSHNFVAEINAAIDTTTDADIAWPRYRAALLSVNGQLPPDLLVAQSIHSDSTARLFAQGCLRGNPELLSAIREAAALPRIGFRLSDMPDQADVPWMYRHCPAEVPQPLRAASQNPALLSIPIPYVPRLRCFAQLLESDAVQAAEESDGSRVVADLIGMIGIANQFHNDPLDVVDAASYKLLHESVTTLGAIINQFPLLLDAGQLTSLAARIEAYAGGAALSPRLSGDRMVFEDIVQRAYTDDGQGDGSAIVDRLFEVISPGEKSSWLVSATAPLTSGYYATRRDLMAKYNAIMDESRDTCSRPLWQCVELPGAAVQRFSEDERRRYMLIWLFVPGVSNSYLGAQRATQERDAALVVLALARFRAQKQRWPQTLDDLVPAYLKSVPADRFSGSQIKYQYSEGQPVLYSVGVDRDDDGGRPSPKGSALKGPADAATWVPPAKASSAPDGDWVLWPPSVAH